MNKLLIVTALFVLSVAALLWSGWGERQTWNQKVTIEVETPDGTVSNSTILTFVRAKYPKRYSSPKSTTLSLYGEAPFVEIKPNQYLFALSLYDIYAIFDEYAFYYGFEKDETDLIIERMLNDRELPEITSFYKPSFFLFKDIEQPTSIKKINHQGLAWHFGSGVMFKSLKYRLSDERRTRGEIDRILPWVANHRGHFVPNSIQSNSNEPNIESFNRSILSRHYSCTIDSYLMNNLTYGFYRKGVNCGI